MLINRRSFLKGAGALSSRLAVSAQEQTSAPWRTFEVITRVEVLKPAGITRLWMPTALLRDTPFQKTIANLFQCKGGTVRTFKNKAEAMEIIAAEFPAGVPPVLTVTSRVVTRNWPVNFSTPGKTHQANASELQACLRPTKHLPTDGIVKQGPQKSPKEPERM